jgi:hypothetical protein
VLVQRILLALVGIVALVGCGSTASGPATIPVTGEVMLNGQPVAGADVAFMPKVEGPDSASAQAITDDTGRFEVVSLFDQGRTSQAGMLPGAYAVSVTQLEQPSSSARPPRNLLPEKYGSPETSELNAEVDAQGENHFKFELTK